MRLDQAVKLLVFFGDADVEAVQHAEMCFARLPRHLDDLLHAHSAGFRDGLVLGLAMSIGPTVGEASGPHQLIHTGGSLDPVTAEFRGGHLHDAIRCVLARMRHSVWSAPRRTRTRCMAAGDSPPRAGGIGSALSERPGSIADTSRTAISLPLTSKIGAPEQLKSLSSERHSEAVVPASSTVARESNDGTGQSDRDIHGRPRACRLHPCERLASPCWISLRPDSLRRPT